MKSVSLFNPKQIWQKDCPPLFPYNWPALLFAFFVSFVSLGALLPQAAMPSEAPGAQRPARPEGAQPQPQVGTSGLYENSWAVIIGINRFQSSKISRLNYAVNDAQAVARALVPLGFPEKNITLLLNQQATRREIERVLNSVILRATGPNDRLVIFFATHGVTSPLPHGGEEGYLLLYDADPDDLALTAMSMQQIKQIGQRIPAKHILIAVDACYGGYTLVRTQAPPVMDRRYLELVGRSRVIQVLTAGRKDQPVIEEQGHGVFTRKLLDGLAGHADENRDGLVTTAELGAWMHPRVAQASEYKQDMQWGNLDGEGQFVFVVQVFGALAITSKVSGVNVWLDDRWIGKTESGKELLLSNVAVGTRRIAAKKGTRSWERSVDVAANRRVNLLIELEEEFPKAIRGDDGAEMVLIPAGEFLMGVPREGVAFIVEACKNAGDLESECRVWIEAEAPRHRVILDPFYMDRDEVTNSLFERFVKATGHRTTAERVGSGMVRKREGSPPRWIWLPVDGATWRSPSGPGSTVESTHPVVQVSWYDASMYCKWAGKRLPTEAEWEKAARGTDGRPFPWGDRWDTWRANVQRAIETTAPVGTYPDGISPYGVHDMVGNVWEWVEDWFDSRYYERTSERNPQGPDVGTRKITRGGGWYNNWIGARTTRRGNARAEHRDSSLGFRCAKGLP